MSRKERERLHRRNEIVTAARQIFAAKGFAGATLEEIAERAEFGKGTLYNYFSNKEELFEAVISDTFDRFVEIAEEHCMDAGKSVRQAVLGYTEAMLALMYANPELVFLLMREMHKPEQRAFITALLPDFVSILEQPFRRAAERGEIASCNTDHLAQLFMTMVFSLFQIGVRMSGATCQSDTVHAPDPVATERLIAENLSLLSLVFLEGLLTDAFRTDPHPEAESRLHASTINDRPAQ